MAVTTLSTELGGRTLTIETGKLALLAGGSVMVRYGDTVVLGAANRSDPRPGLDFFPLTVDFEERMYAAGKIPGGFIKREARPSEAAILAARLTDRPIRPLFPEGYKDDVQVVLTVLSADQENDPDVLGTIAASAALTISDVPFLGPIAAVRIGRIDGEFIVNPTIGQLDESDLDLVVSGTRDAIMMVEAGAKILPETIMGDAIMFAHRTLRPIIDLQEQLREQVGKPKRTPVIEPGTDSVLTFLETLRDGGEFVVIDLETTSRDARLGEIVEMAAVRVAGGRVTDRWSTLVRPSRGIVGAQLHGIGEADVAAAPSAEEAARQLKSWVGDALLVGHNVTFDLAFLKAALGEPAAEAGRYVDTMVIAREAYPDADLKLADLVRFFGLTPEPTHRALPDAEATAALLIHLSEGLPARVEAYRSQVADSIRLRAKGGDEAEADRLLEAARVDSGLRGSLVTLLHKHVVRELVLSEGIRMDGRDPDTIRPITVDVGLLPRAHGSALFTRGQTQALTVATLGPSSDVQRIDTISPEESKRYLHHYNFPPYSVGENRPMRGPGRREIGHGALAERALVPVLPSQEDFPYVIRLVSEVVTSNGSTSMASTCGSTLALMDAGVPITAPVAGAAMGLITEGDRFTVLADILGKEDAFGDMDFKVTGTADGITALQMDIKVQGIGEPVIRAGLQKAYAARMHILGRMLEVIPSARGEVSAYAPRIITIKINPEKIRDIIGKGGAMIRKIQEETGTEINVEDDGSVEIAAVNSENSRKAIQWIESLTREVEVGALYLGKVTRIMGFGCFVEILPGKEGLVRIGELADYHVPTVEDVVQVGDEIMVVVTEIDRQGRVNLSRKAAMQRHLARTDGSGR
jgi:polyribonucleotide nucleotidyltransferase